MIGHNFLGLADVRAEATRLEEVVSKLQAALLPFALLDISHLDGRPDDYPIFGINGQVITTGDIRAAAGLLADSSEGSQ